MQASIFPRRFLFHQRLGAHLSTCLSPFVYVIPGSQGPQARARGAADAPKFRMRGALARDNPDPLRVAAARLEHNGSHLHTSLRNNSRRYIDELHVEQDSPTTPLIYSTLSIMSPRRTRARARACPERRKRILKGHLRETPRCMTETWKLRSRRSRTRLSASKGIAFPPRYHAEKTRTGVTLRTEIDLDLDRNHAPYSRQRAVIRKVQRDYLSYQKIPRSTIFYFADIPEGHVSSRLRRNTEIARGKKRESVYVFVSNEMSSVRG